MNQVKQDIRKFVVDNFLFGQDHGLAEGESFLETGLIDSTGVLELVAYLETTYDIKVRDDELTPDNLDSINSIAAYLEKKCATRSGPT